MELATREQELKTIRIVSTVRGGGLGNRAYVAQLVGLDSKWTFQREHIHPIDDLSNSRKSGTLSFDVPCIDGSVWECYRIMPARGQGSIAAGPHTFWFTIRNGTRIHISRTRAVEILAGY